MLPALAFLAALGNPAEEFIAECSKAVFGIKEGVWAMGWTDDEGKPHGIEVVKKGGEARMLQISGGKTLVDSVVGTTESTFVLYTERKYFVQSYPAQDPGEKPDPLPPLEEGELQFKIDEKRGFILRSNPAFQLESIVTDKGKETMTAKAIKSDGKEGRLTLVRDAKSKLPSYLKVVSPKGTSEFRLLFRARKVDDKEMKMDPERYKGFEKIEPPSGNL